MRGVLAMWLLLATAAPTQAATVQLPRLEGRYWAFQGIGCDVDGMLSFRDGVMNIHDDLETPPRPYRLRSNRFEFADGGVWRVVWAGRASFEVESEGERYWIVSCGPEEPVAEGEERR